jgi:hypothetical protein
MARAVSASHLVLSVRQEDLDAVIRLCALDPKVASRSTEDGITALQVSSKQTHLRAAWTFVSDILLVCIGNDVVPIQLSNTHASIRAREGMAAQYL